MDGTQIATKEPVMLRKALTFVVPATAMVAISAVATLPPASAAELAEHSRETVSLSLVEQEYQWLCGETTVYADDGGEMVTNVVTTTVDATTTTTTTGVAHGLTGHLSDGTPVRIRYSSTWRSVVLYQEDGGFELLHARQILRFVFIGPDGVIGTWRQRWDSSHTSRDLEFGSCRWSGQ
jgi:hypothetical protein